MSSAAWTRYLVPVGLVTTLMVALTPVTVRAESVSLSAETQVHPLGRYLRYFEDRDGVLSLGEARRIEQSGKFQLSTDETPAFGFTDSAYWFTLEISNPNDEVIERMFEIAYPLLDNIELYLIPDQGDTQHFHAGDLEAFEERVVVHRNFVFPLVFSPRSSTRVFMRVQTSGSLQVPVTLWGDRAFMQDDQRVLIGQGLYYGIMLVMVLYNLMLFVSIRGRSYLFYVGYVLSIALFQAAMHGVAYQYLWPNSLWWNEICVGFFVSAILLFMALFSDSFLNLRTTEPRLSRLMRVCAVIAGVLGCAAFVVPYGVVIRVSAALVLMACPLALYAGIKLWIEGYRPARYFTIAWSTLLAGAILMAANKSGFIPRVFVTENALQIGSAIEVVLLSLALADRINTLDEQRIASELDAKHTRQLLIQSEKLSTLGEMVSSIGHEMLSPISSLGLSVEVLEQLLSRHVDYLDAQLRSADGAEPVLDAVGQHFTDMTNIMKNTRTASERIRDLSSALRIQSRLDVKAVPDVEVNELLRESLVITQGKTKHLDIVVDLLEALPTITCFRSQVGQVLTNLISNSADACNEKFDRLRLTSEEYTPVIRVSSVEERREGVAGVLAVVADNGDGVPVEIREQIFEKFFTTKEAGVGTGLGLSLCAGIIKSHGGTLMVSDDADLGGARFDMWLPLVSPEEAS